MPLLSPEDLTAFDSAIPFEKALAMIEDAEAVAARLAPCILVDGFEHVGAAKAILRGAVLRWHEAGTGAMSQVSSGPFQMSTDTRSPRRGMFLPSEIAELQALCRDGKPGLSEMDTMPAQDAVWPPPDGWWPL